LQAFDFSVQYRKGTQIAHVDCLSRNPIPEASKTINKEVEVRVDLSVITDNWLIPEQQRDLGIVDIMNQINGGEMQVDRAKTFEVRAGMLHRKIQRSGKTRCLPVVPRAFRWSAGISLFGVPSRIIADQGRTFASGRFRDFCSSNIIQLHLIATGASRANGQVERVMSTLKGMLIAVDTSERSWQDALMDTQLAMNCTSNRVTNFSPLELLIGKKARPLGMLPIKAEPKEDCKEDRAEAKENMDKNAKYDKSRVDQNKAIIVKHGIGDHVLLRSEERHQTKLDPKFKGPFVVTELLEGPVEIID